MSTIDIPLVRNCSQSNDHRVHRACVYEQRTAIHMLHIYVDQSRRSHPPPPNTPVNEYTHSTSCGSHGVLWEFRVYDHWLMLSYIYIYIYINKHIMRYHAIALKHITHHSPFPRRDICDRRSVELLWLQQLFGNCHFLHEAWPEQRIQTSNAMKALNFSKAIRPTT